MHVACRRVIPAGDVSRCVDKFHKGSQTGNRLSVLILQRQENATLTACNRWNALITMPLPLWKRICSTPNRDTRWHGIKLPSESPSVD